MKYYQTITALGFAFLATTTVEAKTITVDNKAGSVAMYTSVQTACNGADPGDTILIAGSPTSYGHVDLRKRLNILGPGYWAQENNIPGITKDAALLSIHFGRLELSTSANSTITGIQVIYMGVESGVNGIFIDECYLTGNPYAVIAPVSMNRTYSEVNLAFLSGSSIKNSVLQITSLQSGSTARNCIFMTNVASEAGSSISSSIFVNTDAQNFTANVKGSVTHSLAVGGIGVGGNPSFLPSGSGNISTIAFNAQTFIQGQARDKAFQLAPGSPAIGTGLNGVDMGIFGGVLPYVISGVPAIPRITRFLVPSTATSSSGLHIEMDAQSF